MPALREAVPITSSPDVLSGEPVFAGTRVPVAVLFEYLAAGDSLAEFLDDFPSIGRDHALRVLDAAEQRRADREEE